MNTITQLQTALMDADCASIPFATGGEDHTTAITSLPDATIIRVLMYGKRMMNDYVNSAKATGDKDAETLSAEWLARAKAGELGASGITRASQSPLEKAQRDIVVDYLRKSGMKANEARKAAKDPQAAFKTLLEEKITLATGSPASEADITAAFETNWVKVEIQAARVVEATQGLDIDIAL